MSKALYVTQTLFALKKDSRYKLRDRIDSARSVIPSWSSLSRVVQVLVVVVTLTVCYLAYRVIAAQTPASRIRLGSSLALAAIVATLQIILSFSSIG